MKYLAIKTALLCLFAAAFNQAPGQDQPWIDVSRDAEFFRVSMPNQPAEKEQTKYFREVEAKGKLYESDFQRATYAVWSLEDSKCGAIRDVDECLDAMAEMTWGDLLKSARDQLPDDARAQARMTYVKELQVPDLPGREYFFNVGPTVGTARLYVARSRIYILMASHPAGDLPLREKFFSSFVVSGSMLMPPPVKVASGVSVPVVANTDPADYNRVFSSREVAPKARIFEKTEPTYTEPARMFGITGTVVLRAVFSKDGEVTNLRVVRKLPHGLTEQALKAARAIRFTPAMKDGHPVSVWMELQYNFNLY
ncbi:MAG: energy transducer TonB [Pyrinomonadaceae bacterium]